MSGNTSQTGGPLAPTDPLALLADPGLTDFFQEWVVGITGMPGDMVRPRWQPAPPNQPPASATWCALGVVGRTQEAGFPATVHDGAGAGGLGVDEQQRHETLDFLASFYGPAGADMAGTFTSGAYVSQNSEPLLLAGMGLVDVGDITVLPDLTNGKWVQRADVPFRIRRVIRRVYPVRNLLDAPVLFTTSTP